MVQMWSDHSNRIDESDVKVRGKVKFHGCRKGHQRALAINEGGEGAHSP